MYIHGQFKDIDERIYTVIISDGKTTPDITRDIRVNYATELT